MKKIFILITFIANFLNALSNLDEMSLEEKIGQLLIVHFNGEIANEDAVFLIQKLHVGGFIYYNWANGLTDFDQVLNLSQSLQKEATKTHLKLPLFICVDHEGGVVKRFGRGFSDLPSNGVLGQKGDLHQVEEVYRIRGTELRAAGINMNLAPVVDVNSNPKNPVIGMRAFGSDPLQVTVMGHYALEGLKSSSTFAVLKHYPGYGDVSVDPHEALPVLNKTMEELQKCELVPYKTLAKETELIMSAHLLIPKIDSECVTFSKKMVKEYLRIELKFQGLIMTDSLVMKGILSMVKSPSEAAIRSFEAGHDLLLLGGGQLNVSKISYELTVKDVELIHQNLVDAVKNGRISLERVNESVQRIINLKDRM